MRFNKEQQQAIDTIDKNVLVSAGAGTGKTGVLTARFINLIENGKFNSNPIDEILAITFTNKAAEEMNLRIRKAIKENFSKGEKWRQYYNHMSSAKIQTIHSFCSDLLRNFPIEAGIDPSFEIMEPYDSDKILSEATISALKELSEKGSEELASLYNFMGKTRLEDAVSDFKKLYRDLKNTDENTKDVFAKTKISLKAESYPTAEEKNFIIETLKIVGEKKNTKIYKHILSNDYFEKFENNSDDINFELLFYEHIYKNLGTNKKYEGELEKIRNIINGAFLAYEYKNISHYKLVLKIIDLIDERYTALKSSEGVLDYDDLLILANRLLENSEVLGLYQKRISYIMIDEYQDTNALQRDIFYKLASVKEKLDRNNFFVVGDPKQSIYAFRGADLSVFYETKEDILAANGKIIALKENYRNAESILDMVNRLYEKNFEDYVSLNHNRTFEDEVFKVIDYKEEGRTRTDKEAKSLAKMIEKEISNGSSYGDIAVLFRASTHVDYLENVFNDRNIPFLNYSSKGFYSAQEIIDMANLFRVISNPGDILSLIGLMRSPIMAVSDEVIARFRFYSKDIDKGILEYIERENTKEAKALKTKLNQLNSFSELSYRMTLTNLIEYVFQKLDIYAIYANKNNSENPDQALENLSKFYDMARTLDLKDNFSIDDFVEYIEENRDKDEEEAEVSKELDAVTLMTIHGSKGLEFPIVFMYDNERPSRGANVSIRYDKDKGIAIKNRYSYGLFKNLAEIENEKDAEEFIRINYVAMTRAEKKLYISMKNMHKSSNNRFRRFFSKLDENLYDYESFEDIEKEKQKLNFKKPNLNIEKKTPLLMQNKIRSNVYKKMSSITAYQLFKECPRCYYYKYIARISFDNIEERKEELKEDIMPLNISGSIRGIIVHEMIENYKTGMDYKEELKNIAKQYIKLDENIYKDLLRLFENYLKTFKANDEILKEVHFVLPMPAGYINGYIDMLRFTDDGIEIIDFKTNKIYNLDELISYYEPQILLYAYAAKEIYKKEVLKGALHFLDIDKTVEIALHKDKIESLMDDINSYLSFISKHDSIDHYEKNCNCERCK